MALGRAAQMFNRVLRWTTGYQFTYTQPRPHFDMYGRSTLPEQPLYINVGAGYSNHPLWHALENPRSDYAKSRYGDIAFDLTSGQSWPVESNSVELIFSSHTIEHLNDEFNDQLFREALRCLVPGGLLRITCPNIDLYVDAYERADEHFFKYVTHTRKGSLSHSMEQILLYAFAGPLSKVQKDSMLARATDEEVREAHQHMQRHEFLDHFVRQIPVEAVRQYPREHKAWLTPSKLVNAMKLAGFEDAWQSAYGQSRSALMRDVQYFDRRHPSISLYVEARKGLN